MSVEKFNLTSESWVVM